MENLTRFVETLAPYGDFTKIKEIDTIIDNIIKTLSIPRGSYIGDPEVGSNLFNYVYDQMDEFTIENVKHEIEISLAQIEGIKLKDIFFEITSDRKGLIVKMVIDVLAKVSKIITIIITKEYINLLAVEENY